MKYRPRHFLIALTVLLASLVQAQEPAADGASKERLTFPILFAARHNYQGLHIYDTF